MDFLDPKKKRSHRIRLFIGYGLMAILIGIGATILLYQASGFDVDPRTGNIIHNGLVFVDAHPEAADVFLNGKLQGQTDMRLVIPEGQYEIKLQREGYRTWQKSFQLEGSRIERLVYPFMFPVTLRPEEAKQYTERPRLATQSPDRRWLLLQRSANLHEFEAIDLGNPQDLPTKAVTLPATLFTASEGVHNLELIEWSSDNRHVVLKHSYPNGQEFILLDHVDPGLSLNLSRHFATPFTDVTLRDKRPDQFYLLNKPTGVLWQANSRNQQLVPALGNVIEFQPYGENVIMYTTAEDATEGRVSVKLKDREEVFKLRELVHSDKYLLDLTRFDGSWYMAVGSHAENRVYIYQNAFETLKNPNAVLKVVVPVAILKLDAPEFLSISANARFYAIQSGSKVAVYDAEKDRQHNYDTGLKLAPNQELKWMDGHRFISVVESKVVVFDYDGINKQELIGAYDGIQPFFDRDYDNMFTISPLPSDATKAGLFRTPMRVDD